MTNKIRLTLKRSEIIRSRDEISRLFKQGKRIHLAGLTLYLLPSDNTRACFIVKKDLGNAVVRNRHKRWLREIFRKHKYWFKNNDVMFYLNRKHLIAESGYQYYLDKLESYFGKYTK